MTVPGLRKLLRDLIGDLKDRGTHDTLPLFCEQLGLKAPETAGSKRERLYGSFDASADSELVHIAERYLHFFPPRPELRNQIQEQIWQNAACPEVPKRFRREIANRLDKENLFISAKHFMQLLDNLWILDNDPFGFLTNNPSGLRSQIEKHVIENQGDWPVDHLFEELGAYECSDRRFLLFLEGLTSADVSPAVDAQNHLVTVLNTVLLPCQIELQLTGTEGGYPVFTAVAVGKNVRSSPKNLIFASQVKPDLRFSDAINNDVQVVSNADKVLIYDRPIGVGGLSWKDLQDWWAEHNQLAPDAAKKSLYRRLIGSLPVDSPPQRLLFETYFKHFSRAIPNLPALLPEVWLHWDPKTVRERGKDALLRFRMDFLLLLPNSVRIVIEVDGRHHYADSKAQADPQKYAEMVAADRDLRLAGYDVYRFGAFELDGEIGIARASNFFERLFKLYKVDIAM